MKTVEMMRDFAYRPFPRRPILTAYLAGVTYTRVPEAAVDAIVSAGAGRVVEPEPVGERA